MSGCAHVYVVGEDDPACVRCRERKSASELDTENAQALAEHTIRAVRLMRDEIARIETDRYHARVQKLRAERNGGAA